MSDVGWHEIDTAELGKTVSLWAYGWRHPFPGKRVGDFGKVILDDLKDGRESYATHWTELQEPPRPWWGC